MRPTMPNIIKIYNAATEDHIREGLSWYRDAHALASELDPSDPDRAAGVIAALSPRESWTRNVYLATLLYERNGDLQDGTLTSNLDKARRIFNGEAPLDVLGGDKVRAFYTLISDPDNADAVCVDRHAFDVAVGRKTDDKTRQALGRKGAYDRFARAYRRAAEVLGVTPAQVQAVTWVAWRQGVTA
jgi:hypothetical protein